ncbi:protein LURP-one-related 8-like [Magnolia sinica]|uniref:protein LURP-one-related 8-like n=1 Tax=Magnolia sinica TaxID=86752 RepID=UPI002658D319|nr:protein LURP-one-related 8-like [Magnolia sinica]
MTKVYPNAASVVPKADSYRHVEETLTVWKKSLLFNCNGFAVFDTKGNLVFRVDNYMAGNKGEILLMDAAGKPLLTIRRKKLSFGDHWLVFDGEETVNPRFSVKKNVNILKSSSLAHVTLGSGASPKHVIYHVEGSYSQRCCTVYDDKRYRMAEIKRKEAVGGAVFGLDVFRLIVQPEFDTAVAMSLVILLEQMFGSTRRFGK